MRDPVVRAEDWAAAVQEQPVLVPVPVYPCTTEADLSCREGKQADSLAADWSAEDLLAADWSAEDHLFLGVL